MVFRAVSSKMPECPLFVPVCIIGLVCAQSDFLNLTVAVLDYLQAQSPPPPPFLVSFLSSSEPTRSSPKELGAVIWQLSLIAISSGGACRIAKGVQQWPTTTRHCWILSHFQSADQEFNCREGRQRLPSADPLRSARSIWQLHRITFWSSKQKNSIVLGDFFFSFSERECVCSVSCVTGMIKMGVKLSWACKLVLKYEGRCVGGPKKMCAPLIANVYFFYQRIRSVDWISNLLQFHYSVFNPQ